MAKSVILIKLGGAVITNKDIPMSVRTQVLRRLVGEIARARQEKNLTVVIGNGAGSFAHVPAAHYRTMEGFVLPESRMGMAITQDSAAQLNRRVVAECLKQGIPAVTVAPSNSLVTKERKADTFFTDAFETYLQDELVPVVYGDVLADRKMGCTIWSTDTVFNFFAHKFYEHGWKVEQIIHVTEASGVWRNDAHEIYPKITEEMRDEVRGKMVDTKGFDVTGGMWHKIEESLSLAELNIPTRILSGLQKEALYKTLIGEDNIGTQITKS